MILFWTGNEGIKTKRKKKETLIVGDLVWYTCGRHLARKYLDNKALKGRKLLIKSAQRVLKPFPISFFFFFVNAGCKVARPALNCWRDTLPCRRPITLGWTSCKIRSTRCPPWRTANWRALRYNIHSSRHSFAWPFSALSPLELVNSLRDNKSEARDTRGIKSERDC